MRKLIASTFVSLDGVMQAPGGPDEDPTGFPHRGWVFPFFDEAIDISAAGFDGKDRELVLGRKTYEIFEAHWPYRSKDDPTAKTLNAARKHVATRTLDLPGGPGPQHAPVRRGRAAGCVAAGDVEALQDRRRDEHLRSGRGQSGRLIRSGLAQREGAGAAGEGGAGRLKVLISCSGRVCLMPHDL